jgi:hypothetical protein
LNGTLVVHSGGKNRTRDELATLPTPEATDTWKPVPHYELVEPLIEGLTAHNIAVTREAYATSGPDDARLFGVLDLLIPDVAVPDFGMSLGIRGSNDRSLAIQATAGARVFVCDNLAFSGDSGTVVLKRWLTRTSGTTGSASGSLTGPYGHSTTPSPRSSRNCPSIRRTRPISRSARRLPESSAPGERRSTMSHRTPTCSFRLIVVQDHLSNYPRAILWEWFPGRLWAKYSGQQETYGQKSDRLKQRYRHSHSEEDREPERTIEQPDVFAEVDAILEEFRYAQRTFGWFS